MTTCSLREREPTNTNKYKINKKPGSGVSLNPGGEAGVTGQGKGAAEIKERSTM